MRTRFIKILCFFSILTLLFSYSFAPAAYNDRRFSTYVNMGDNAVKNNYQIPHMFRQDAPYTYITQFPLVVSGGVEYVPLSMFILYPYIEVNYSGINNSFYLVNNRNGNFISFNVDENIADTHNGEFMKMETKMFYQTRYIPARKVADVLGMACETYDDPLNGIYAFRISNGKSSKTLVDLLTPYLPASKEEPEPQTPTIPEKDSPPPSDIIVPEIVPTPDSTTEPDNNPISDNKPELQPTKPSVEPDKPPTETIKPPVDTTKPPVDTAKPSVDTTKPSVDTTKPSVDTTKPSVDTTKPSVDTTKPSVDTTKPSVDTTKPSVDTTKPSTETAKPPKQETAPEISEEPEIPEDPLEKLDNRNLALCFTGMSYEKNDSVLNTVKSREIEASFSFTREEILANPSFLRKLYVDGYEILVTAEPDFKYVAEQNPLVTSQQLELLYANAFIADLEKANKAMNLVLKTKVRMCTLPYGLPEGLKDSEVFKNTVNQAGYLIYEPNVDSGDKPGYNGSAYTVSSKIKNKLVGGEQTDSFNVTALLHMSDKSYYYIVDIANLLNKYDKLNFFKADEFALFNSQGEM